MSGGGGQTQTSTSSSLAQPQYQAAYNALLGRVTQQGQTPYQPYTGQLQADFSPAQQQGFNVINSANGISAPYINQAAEDYTNATNSLTPSFQPQSTQANQQYQRAANSNLAGAVAPWQTQAQQGFAGGSQAVDPTQYSGSAIQGFESPYTQDVVDATQAQFNQQNAQAQTALSGNAASKGALGGDRLGVAQAQLAGQQQMAQAPVIAGLRNTGFNQAQQEFNQQQATNLSAGQNNAARQLQAAQGFMGLGSQSLTAAQQQAAIEQQAGAGFAGLGQLGLSAAQSQGWLNSQAGQGMAGLGNQALSNTLAEGQADLSAGEKQQQQAQTALNIPYQQWQQAIAYPYQQLNWQANATEGLGGAAGTNGSQTSPSGNTYSQIAGLLTSGVGALGQTGAFGQNGYLTGNTNEYGATQDQVNMGQNNLINNDGSYVTPPIPPSAMEESNRGGAVGFAEGGQVPNVNINGFGGGSAGFDDGQVPDVSGTNIPSVTMSPGSGPKALAPKPATSTTTTGAAQDSPLGSLVKAAGTIAATVYGGPQGGMAANAVGSQIHFNRGGFAHAPGGSAPVLPHGFAAGGSTPITVTTVPDAKGRGVPTMNVDPSLTSGGFSGANGSTSEQLAKYLATTKAGASTALPSYGPPASATPAMPAPMMSQITPYVQDPNSSGVGGGGEGGGEAGGGGDAGGPSGYAHGGFARGFDEGGPITIPPDDDTDTATPVTGFAQPSRNFGLVNNQPAGQRLGDLLHGRVRDASGNEVPVPPVPPAGEMQGPPDPLEFNLDEPGYKQIPKFLQRAYREYLTNQHNLKREADIANPGWRPPVTATETATADASAPTPPAPAPAPIPADTKPPAPADTKPPAPAAGFAGIVDAPDTAAQAIAAGTAPMTEHDTEDHRTPYEIESDDVINRLTKQPTGAAAAPGAGGAAAPSPGTGGATSTSSPPDSSAGFAGAPTAPPTADSNSPARRGLTDTSSELKATRALQEDKASPWLALMQAGFGMMAGRSGNALQNIGTGAESGLSQYVSADKAAKELAAKVDENRVRLAETQAWREQQGNNYANRTQAQSDWHMAQIQATQAWHDRVVANQSRGMDITQARDEANNYFKDANLEIAGGKLRETTRHNQVTEGQTDQRIAIIMQNMMNTDAWRTESLRLKREGLADAQVNSIMQEAGKNVARDLSGKKTLANEVAAQQKLRSGVSATEPTAATSAQTQAPAAAARTAAPPLPPGVPVGSVYSASRKQWRDPAGNLWGEKAPAAAAP